MAAPAKKEDLVEISTPGFKMVYHTAKDANGKTKVTPYTMPDIDATEAVTKFPDEYSLEQPAKGELQPPVGAHDPFSAAPVVPAPTPIASQATPGADTSVGAGVPASAPVEPNPAVTARAQADNDKAADAAVKSGGKSDDAKK